jgi:hypothetical protein
MRGQKTGTASFDFFFKHGSKPCRIFPVVFMWSTVRGILLSIGGFSRRLKEKNMNELLIIVGFFAVWFLLQIYILPKLGISS